MRRILHIIGPAVGAAALACQARAGEFAVLTNGNRLAALRHEADGARIRLFHKEGETVLPAQLVERFEEDGILPAPPPAPVAASTEALPPPPPAPKTPQELAGAAAREFALPEAFIRSVMRAESGFQIAATSPKGAIGLMQLMPATAHELGVNPHDPAQNVAGGARYLRDLLARYEGHPDQVLLALAAYNAGPGAVEKYHGVPPFAETRNYIVRVVERWKNEAGLK